MPLFLGREQEREITRDEKQNANSEWPIETERQTMLETFYFGFFFNESYLLCVAFSKGY